MSLDTNILAKRYAQALFQLAVENDDSERSLKNLEAVMGVLDHDMVSFFDSPAVSEASKMKIAEVLLDKLEVGEWVKKFVLLLVENRLVELIPGILFEYGAALDLQRGIVRAEIATAVAVEDDFKEKITQDLSRIVGKKVIPTFNDDSNMLGGIRIKLGDKLIDGSTRARLMSLKRYLAQNVL